VVLSEGGKHRERNTGRNAVTRCSSVTGGPLARTNYPLLFYYDLNWCTTSMELTGLGTMLEIGTRRRPDE